MKGYGYGRAKSKYFKNLRVAGELADRHLNLINFGLTVLNKNQKAYRSDKRSDIQKAFTHRTISKCKIPHRQLTR